MEHHDDNLTLVLGGTGKTGRRVAERLAARRRRVRIGSRRADPPFDWDDPATWPASLAGATAAYVSYQPDLAVPTAAATVRSFSDLAVASGVRRLVLVSGRGEDGAVAAEEQVQASGADWTIVRASWFAQNFDEGYLLDPVVAGEVALPAGDVPEPFVDADDIADVATAALIDARHAGRVYELTGPRALTFADAVAEIARAAGRPVRYVRISPQELATALDDQEVPREVTELLLYLFSTVLDGRNARPADGVREALGRPPRDFADYARRAAATGVWSPSVAVLRR